MGMIYGGIIKGKNFAQGKQKTDFPHLIHVPPPPNRIDYIYNDFRGGFLINNIHAFRQTLIIQFLSASIFPFSFSCGNGLGLPPPVSNVEQKAYF